MSQSLTRGIADHERLLGDLRRQANLLDQIGRALIAAIEAGNRIYVIGNGGSAADAQHIAAELLGRFKTERRALPALALTTDTSTLLAVANDLGFDRVFSRQLEGLIRSGDVLWALSTSGNSPNIVQAVELARTRGALVIGFTGRGGCLKPQCDLCLCIDHDTSDRIQEMHLLAYHLICEQVEQHFTVE